MTCYPRGGRAFVCPDDDALERAAIALLPNGDAWATSDGAIITTSTMTRYWRAVGRAFGFLYGRLCALREEFRCATQVETRPEWLHEYGLPDACDPFPDLCLKVAAIGGARCEDLISVAARAGWAIECGEGCGAEAGAAEPGLDPVGSGTAAGTLYLIVHANQSPSYVHLESQAEAGCLEAGAAVRCDPLEALRCLLERVVHAHLFIDYLIIED